MAVHGKIDAAAFSNTIGVVNGDATVTKNAGDTVVVGDVLNISSVNYIVKQVTSTTAIELHKAYAGSTATVLLHPLLGEHLQKQSLSMSSKVVTVTQIMI